MLVKDLKSMAMDYQFAIVMNSEHDELWRGWMHDLPAILHDVPILKLGTDMTTNKQSMFVIIVK